MSPAKRIRVAGGKCPGWRTQTCISHIMHEWYGKRLTRISKTSLWALLRVTIRDMRQYRATFVDERPTTCESGNVAWCNAPSCDDFCLS